MNEGMEFVKVYLTSGNEMAFPVSALSELEEAVAGITTNEYIHLKDSNGSLKIFRADMISLISHSTPESRENWTKNAIKLQHESNRVSAKLSDPLNQL